MEKIHKLFREITLLTTNIEVNYPELYQFLGEDPITIPSNDHPYIDVEVMQDYLESLKELLARYLETHIS
jgi:hypothetical protein